MNSSPKKILIIEDDLIMRDIVVRKLSYFGHDISVASDGKEGLEIIAKETPDLIVLDLLLPEMDGFTVLERIRSNENKKIASTPVIILSNLWSNQDKARIQELKVEDYLIKSLNTTEEIAEKINRIIKSLSEKSG
ncbi:MAG: response regulator [bacterium]